MKLEQQVCSLELAQKWKEFGVKQESLFYWYPKTNAIVTLSPTTSEITEGIWVSAFTVAELGEMLPELCMSGRCEGGNYNCWWLSDMCIRDIKHMNNYQTKIEADARAKMLIYLLENKLI